jgi:hypothetical protein
MILQGVSLKKAFLRKRYIGTIWSWWIIGLIYLTLLFFINGNVFLF